MKNSKRIFSVVLVLSLALSILFSTVNVQAAAKKPKLAKKTATIEMGKTTKIKIKNKPKRAKITYRSSKKSVAKVSKKGTVKGLKPGKATIKVTIKKKKKLVKKLNFKVKVKTVNADKDDDGVPDVIDQDNGKLDSDGDGLTDYQEYTYTNTDPYKYSTHGNGVSDADSDEDGDGISNKDEIKNGTNPIKVDSDDDDLSDNQEELYNTNPIKSDSDGDGASDGWEVKNGFDPLIYNSSFDIEKKESVGSTDVAVKLNDSGNNVSSVNISESKNALLTNKLPGYLAPACDFSASSKIDSAEISFSFDESKSYDSSVEPTIYYYNETTQELEEVPTTVNGNVATATVHHFSTYVLLDKNEFNKVWSEEIRKPQENSTSKGVSIVFVLDRSMSMDDNDPYNLRKSLTTQFINKLDSDDYGSIISFIAKTEPLTGLTNSKRTLINAVNSIVNDDGHGENSGTNGSAGINEAITQLSNDQSGNSRYIVFMTDGEDNRYSYSYTSLIRKAKNNDITIFPIGLKDVDNDTLERLATETGGTYYYASESSKLVEGFEKAEQETIDYHTDSNDDGISDYYTKLLCNGTLVSGTGVPIFKDIPYNDVQKNNDYDGDGVKNGDEVSVIEDGDKVYLQVKSSPENIDSDEDGILDDEDSAPLKKGLAGGIIGEMTIVSCHPDDSGFSGGHAWLAYKSYINDSIDVSKLLNGYVYDYTNNSFVQDKIDSYDIKKNGYIAIGNAGTKGTSGALSTIAGSCGGILYNREFYASSVNPNFYLGVAAYTRVITDNQFNDLMNYCGDNSYYNLYSHNCSSVASEAWEAAFGESDGFKAKKTGLSNNVYSLFDTPSTLKENILKKMDADKDYRSTMLSIIQGWV